MTNFIGRKEIIDRVLRLLDGDLRTIIVVGDPGIGKTALAKHITQICRPAASHFCRSREGSTIDPLAFVRELNRQLMQNLEGFSAAVGDLAKPKLSVNVQQTVAESPGSKNVAVQVERLFVEAESPHQTFQYMVREPLINWAATHSSVGAIVIVVDGLDEALRFERRPNIIDLLLAADDLPNGVHWIVTTRPIEDLDLFLNAEQIKLHGESEENLADARSYVDNFVEVSNLAQNMPQERLSELKQAIVERSQGNFLYLSHILPDLEKRVRRSEQVDLVDLPRGLEAYYRKCLVDGIAWQTQFYQQSAMPVLGSLAVAFEPMPFATLAAVSGVDEQTTNQVVVQFQAFLRGAETSDGTISMYHSAFADFLTSREASGSRWIDPLVCHRRIVEQYMQSRSVGWDACDDYGVRNLPRHLKACSRLADLKTLLFTYGYIQTASKREGVNSLIAATSLVDLDPEIERLRAALRLASHILMREPWRLAEQLTGRLRNSSGNHTAELISDIRNHHQMVWLRPLNPSLSQPGGHEVRTLQADLGPITAIRFAGKPERLIVGYKSGSLVIWDVQIGEPVADLSGHAKAITCIAASEKRLLSGALDGEVIEWDLERRVRKRTVVFHESPVLQVAIGEECFTCVFGDGVVIESDIANSHQARTLTLENFSAHGGQQPVITPASHELIHLMDPTTLGVWDLRSGLLSRQISEVTDGLWNHAFAVSGSAHSAVTASHDRLHVWDVATGKQIASEYIGHFQASRILIGSLEKLIYLGGATGGGWGGSKPRSRIECFDLDTLRPSKSFRGNVGGMNDLAVSSDQSTAVSVGRDHVMKVWNLNTDDTAEVAESFVAAAVQEITISPDGRLAACAHDANCVAIWDTASTSLLRVVSVDAEMWYRAPAIGVLTSRFSEDGQYFFTGSGSGALRILRVQGDLLEAGEECGYLGIASRGHFKGNYRPIMALTHVPGTLTFAAGDAEGSVIVWSLINATKVSEWQLHASEILFLQVIRETGEIVAASKEGIKVWNPTNGTVRIDLRSEQHAFSCFQLAGENLFAGSEDGTVHVWNVQTGDPSAQAQVCKAPVVRLAATCHRTFWASAKGHVGLWSLSNPGGHPFTIGHSGRVWDMALSADGTLITVGEDCEIKVWSPDGQTVVTSFKAESALMSCAVESDNKTVLAGERSGRLHFLRIERGNIAPVSTLAG